MQPPPEDQRTFTRHGYQIMTEQESL
jgi:hypothetical protein